jgi:hypothetical protein
LNSSATISGSGVLQDKIIIRLNSRNIFLVIINNNGAD